MDEQHHHRVTPESHKPQATDAAPRVRWGHLLRITLILVVLAAAVRFLSDVDWDTTATAFRRTRLSLFLLAALLNITVNTLARVERRRTLLAPLPCPGPGIGLGELTSLFLLSLAANNLLPARAGDALYTVEMRRRHGYPVGSLVASVLVEKLVEMLTLWLLVWPALLLVPSDHVLHTSLYAAAGIGLAFAAALVWTAGRRNGDPPLHAPVTREGEPRSLALATFLPRLREALRLLHGPRIWSRAVAWSLASDLTDAMMIGLCLAATGLPAGFGAWALVLLVVNAAILIPSTPGQVGIHEAGAVLALSTFGVPQSEALAFAILYHGAHFLPVTLCGALALPGLLRRRRTAGGPASPEPGARGAGAGAPAA